jgi:hypothetical protein
MVYISRILKHKHKLELIHLQTMVSLSEIFIAIRKVTCCKLVLTKMVSLV